MVSATIPKRAAPAHVLVVDDEVDMLDLIRTLLEPQGVLVDTATDGRLALKLAKANSYHVVVTDISMPYMDGIELGNALRSDTATAHLTIIVHSALDEACVRSSFAGYDLFLAKPHESAQVAEAVLKLLHKRFTSAVETVALTLP